MKDGRNGGWLAACGAMGLALWCAGAVQAQTAVTESVSVQTNREVLIATEKSEFKDGVVDRVTQALKQKGHPSKVVDHKQLAQESVDRYDGIVILNTIWAWHLRGKVAHFLKPLTDDQRRKVVLVSTADGEDWKTKEKGVHAVTSASKMVKVDEVAAFVIRELEGIWAK
jgi:hypothetical protein